MTAQNRSTLYGYFQTNDKPTQGQFQDLIDSSLNLIDPTAQSIASNVSAQSLDLNGNFTVKSSAAASFTGNTSVAGFFSVTGSAAASFSGNATVTGGVVLGTASGGNKGSGTLNATAIYIGGNQITQSISINPIAGSFINASMSVTTASASATFTADQIVAATSLGGNYHLLSSYSQSINLGTTGAGGMDTGSAPASGFVSLYAIFGTSGTSILACNVTISNTTIYSGSNLPSGYTYSALIGIWPTNGSRQFIVGIQKERFVSFNSIMVLTGGTQTSATSFSLASAVPAGAKTWFGSLGLFPGTSGSTPYQVVIQADSGGTNQILAQSPGAAGWGTININFNFGPIAIITSQTAYYFVTNVGTGTTIDVSGYTF